MRIRVENIPAPGQRVNAGLDAVWARDAARDALDALPTELSASFAAGAPKDGRVTVRLDARAAVPAVCDRCGEDVTLRVESSSTLDYLPVPPPVDPESDEAEVELEEDELDVGWYTDGHLSLADILTEALALELPSRILCEDEASCDARTEALLASAKSGPEGHPAFAALKNLTN